MITTSQLSEFWHEWAKTIVAILAAGMVTVIVFAVQAWADQKLEPYVEDKDLAAAVKARDLKNVNARLEDLELEISRVDVWLRFSTDQQLKQIYGAEKALLEGEKVKVDREREELVEMLGDPDE